MAATLDIRWAAQAGSAVGSLGPRFYNVSGTPIASIARRDLGEGSYELGAYNGQLVADVYTLNFTTGPQVAVTADLGSKNPWHNLTPVSIVANGSTVHYNVVPGLGIVFSSGTANGNQAVITVGAYLSAGGVDTNALNFGVTKNDGQAHTLRFAVVNTGSDTAGTVQLSALPAGYYSGTNAATTVCRIGPHSSDTRAKLAVVTSYGITFANWQSAGSYYTADVYVGGQLCIATAKFDGETIYEWGSGNGYVDASDLLKGWQIVFAKTSTSPVGNTITFVSAAGWAYVTTASDQSGAAVAYTAGPLTLGDIASGGTKYGWVAMTLPEGLARGAIRLWTPRFRFTEI
jgi:hypothetical protein